MGLKDILVHVDSTSASAVRLHLGLALARHFGSRLSGIHVTPNPDVPPYFKPSAVERIAEIYRENAREAAVLAEARFREATKDAGLVTAWQSIEGDMARLLAERARFSDLLLLGQYDTENPPAISAFLLPQDVVVDAGTPVLVVPLQGPFDRLPRHVLVTWDGSREAARALRDAIPLLQAAGQVSLVAVDPARLGHPHPDANIADAAAHLARHGIPAETRMIQSGDKSVTDALLGHVREIDADLLVMGAYGHPRLKEFVLGGTTQDLLARTPVPVLISH